MQFHFIRTLVLSAFMLLSFSSCSNFFNKTIELDDDNYEKSMVLYCFANQEDNNIRVSISQNFGLTESVKDTAFFLPTTGVQLLSSAGVVPGGFSYTGSGFHQFTGNLNLVPGEKYILKASNGILPAVEGESIMPSAITIDTFKFTADAGSNQFGDKTSRIELAFRDPAGTKDYYSVSVQKVFVVLNPVYDTNGNIIQYDTIRYSNPIAAEEPRDPAALDGIDNEIVFADDLFNGQKYQLRYAFINYSQSQDEVYLKIRHITEAEYRYRVSEGLRRRSEDFPLVEPTIVFSAIKDGIGIFGLSWSKTIRVQ
jgi:Domain of unknown function (DUF4249)